MLMRYTSFLSFFFLSYVLFLTVVIYYDLHFFYSQIQVLLYKGNSGGNPGIIFIFFIYKKSFNQNWINGCDYCGPDASLDTNIGQMSYFLFHMPHLTSNVILCHMTHMTSKMTSSIWPILVSKEASGPRQSNLLIRFCLRQCLKMK